MTLKSELDQLWFRHLSINSSREAGREPQQTPSSLKLRLEPIKLTEREKWLRICSSIFLSLSPHDSIRPADPHPPSLSLSLSHTHTHTHTHIYLKHSSTPSLFWALLSVLSFHTITSAWMVSRAHNWLLCISCKCVCVCVCGVARRVSRCHEC